VPAFVVSRGRTLPVDGVRLAASVATVAAEFRATLKQGGPSARRLLQRVLNGRRVPCVPFREAGRRGYRFREEAIPDSGVMSNEFVAPTGFEPVFTARHALC
jgi:hypothetical protein